MKRILIIDDSRSIHAFVTSCLEGNGFVLEHAMNGVEGLAVLNESLQGANRFDLVFLDWEMPMMTGPELLAELKPGPNTPPVVMLTTRNSSTDIEKALQLGAAEYLMKPFTADVLLGKIADVIGSRD